MAKDSIAMGVGIFAFIIYILWWRWERNETEETFNNYLYHDRNTVRNNLK